MQLFATIRTIALASVVFTAPSLAQVPQSQQQSQTSSTEPARPAPQSAQVTYTDGQLFVSANNSSLNEILRDISRHTGMQITGRVTEERVFGQYGPAAPAKVVADLLDGTGSNVLLLQATATTPAKLILTPRNGGPTPPNPNARQEEEPYTRPQYTQPSVPEGNVLRPQAPPSTPQPSSNTVRTPQQIYEQLQQMRQQQRQQPNPQ